ncbi:MAG: PAS domain-containing protein, partial [Limnospira sp.]
MGNAELIECSRCHYGGNFGSEQLLDLDGNLHRLAKAIERDRKRFGVFAEPTPVMMWISDAQGAYTFFNETWLEFTGRSWEAERGDGWVAGIHPDDRENCLIAYRQASGDRKPFQREYRLRRSDGEYRWICETGVPQRTREGAFLGYTGSGIDITERRRAEEELLHLGSHLREEVARRTAELFRTRRQLQQEIQERLRAREALDRSRKMLQLVTDNIPEAIFWKDCNSVYLGCNRRGAECAGLGSSEAIAGLRDEDLPWGEQADEMRVRDRRVMETDVPEYRHVETRPLPGGSTADWETNRIPLHDNEGEVVGILVTCEDITERRQTEAQILQTARQLTCVIETVGEGITLSDRRGKFIIYNSKMREITGYSLPEAESSQDFLRLLYPDPEAHADALTGLYEILERGGVRDVETTICSKSGDRKTLLVSTSILDNGDDKLFLSSYRDITERKRALDALQVTEQEYRSLFENAIEGIFQTTPEGKYLNVNPALAKIYGYATPGELMAQLTDITRQLYVDPDRRDEFISQLRESEAIVNFESQVYRADGRIIWISEKARAVKDGRGRTLYYEGMVEDVTDRKRAEQNLRQQAERERLMFSIT